MAHQLVTSVLRALVLFLFLCVSQVLCSPSLVTYTREELLNIGQSTTGTFFPVFSNPDSFTEILVGGAAALCRIFRKRRRGKRAGALLKLRQRGFKTPLPSIHLVNIRCLASKMDELLLLNSKNSDFRRSAALCFTETSLIEHIPDDALQLPGFQVFRADRSTELSGETDGGGICFYINEGWCTDVTVLFTSCSPHLETLFTHCKPFYSPWEFSSFVLVGVYVPPQACITEAVQQLAHQITEVEEKTHPDSLLIILGHFNGANLTHELPQYMQHVKYPTQDTNPLDHCYTALKDAYRSVPRAGFGISDHCPLHLIPTYKRK